MKQTYTIKVISDLEDKVKKLNQDNINMSSMLENYNSVIKLIPKETIKGEKITPKEWIESARIKLGYE